MVIFVPAYDDATKTNLLLAENFKIDNQILLFGSEATRDKLFSNITDNDIFLMSHGSTEAVFYKKSESAITCDDSSLIEKKIIFAFACHTAKILGKSIAENNNVWWGYTGAISASDDDDDSIRIITPIFEYIIDNFNKIESGENIYEIVVQIKELCDNAQKQFDLIDKEGFGFMSSRLCIEHIWNRLRVWYGKEPNLYKHPNAPKPDLFGD